MINTPYLNTSLVPTMPNFYQNMDGLLATAKDIANNSMDFEMKYVGKHDFYMEDPRHVSFSFGMKKHRFEVMDYARSQLCSKVGVPASYIDRLAASRSKELRQLACDNINMMARKHFDGQLLLRTTKGKLRGVLTPRYTVFDSDSILEVLADCFDAGILNKDNTVLRSYCNSLDVLNLRFTDTTPIKGLADKDLFFGMDITSSDVGKYSLKINFYIYKQVCTNGLCIGFFKDELYQQRHLGVTADDFRKGVRRSVEAFPRIVAAVKPMLMEAGARNLLDSPVFDMEVDTPAVLTARNNLMTYLGIGQESLGLLVSIARNNYGSSLWGFVNAITEYSQRFRFERRFELENRAGTLLTDFDRVLRKAA